MSGNINPNNASTSSSHNSKDKGRSSIRLSAILHIAAMLVIFRHLRGAAIRYGLHSGTGGVKVYAAAALRWLKLGLAQVGVGQRLRLLLGMDVDIKVTGLVESGDVTRWCSPLSNSSNHSGNIDHGSSNDCRECVNGGDIHHGGRCKSRCGSGSSESHRLGDNQCIGPIGYNRSISSIDVDSKSISPDIVLASSYLGEDEEMGLEEEDSGVIVTFACDNVMNSLE
jgi:hypothetical protein